MVASMTLLVVKQGGFLRGQPDMQQMCIAYHLLQMSTGHKDRPGCFRDYAALRDFTFDLRLHDNNRLHVNVRGTVRAE